MPTKNTVAAWTVRLPLIYLLLPLHFFLQLVLYSAVKSRASTEGMRKISAPPAAIQCLVCHGQFFTASLQIHQKSCFQRNAFALIPCDKCKVPIRASSFHAHTASCSGESPHTSSNNKLIPTSYDARQRTKSTHQNPVELNAPEADGRVRCIVCERAFSQDRISKHQSVCHGKPRSTDASQEQKRRSPTTVQHGQRKDCSREVGPVRTRQKPVHTQLRSLQRSFDFLPERNKQRSSAGQHFSAGSRTMNSPVYDVVTRDISRRLACSYPGARAMNAGGCDMSNASSASNPLVTNSLMTTHR